jgi:gamma-glutamyltranspeptidase/glutathione hydrolase
MSKVAIATTSQIAADAAAEVAAAGGNAVDCAITASLLTMNTEPGVCALAGGAYITVWKPGQKPVTIDGNVNAPGRGLKQSELGRGGIEVDMEYGGGITTIIGPGSVGVPGSLAAVELAWQQFGAARWRDLLQGSIKAAANGFPLSSACHHYLQYSGKPIFSHSEDGFNALHDSAGHLRAEGDRIHVPHLTDSLSQIAEEGASAFYDGDIGQRIAKFIQETGGMLTRDDLAAYRPITRDALCIELGDWQIATNPAPAIGGTMLAAMLLAFGTEQMSHWDAKNLERLIRVQVATLDYRKRKLNSASDMDSEIATMLKLAKSGLLLNKWSSASTVHTSAVDADGLACAITASAGYGSGEMAPGTGIWLNNCLGEIELNAKGLLAGPPGTRLPSNMAPSAARRGTEVLAAGSPGADRITTALHQFFVNYTQLGMSLEQAIRHPRVHTDFGSTDPLISIEPGIQLPDIGYAVKRYPEIGMYFGGVAAASHDPLKGFTVFADPRRAGGVRVT